MPGRLRFYTNLLLQGFRPSFVLHRQSRPSLYLGTSHEDVNEFMPHRLSLNFFFFEETKGVISIVRVNIFKKVCETHSIRSPLISCIQCT